jgi:H(+)-translocating pyrophosphatase
MATTIDAPINTAEPWHVALPGLVAGGVIAPLFVLMQYFSLKSKKIGRDIGKPEIDDLAAQVKSGAKAFLIEEYKYLAAFVIILTAVLAILYAADPVYNDRADGARVAFAFFMGALLSGSAGWFGMMVATDGNSRTTAACTEGTLNDGLKVAFTTGAMMGFTVVGLGLFGVSAVYLILTINVEETPEFFLDAKSGLYLGEKQSLQLLAGFGFGASSIALFARVAGGIYTKAADVGADLVGKVEAGIDEDDPHNPAVIADNVGDNVGDVAGMGADLFESFVGAIIAACTLGVNAPFSEAAEYLPNIGAKTNQEIVYPFLCLPFWLSSLGVFCSIVGCFCVSTKEEGKGWDVKLSSLMWALEKGMYVAGFLFLAGAAGVIILLFGVDGGNHHIGWRIYGCIIIGLFSGMVIGKVTEYFTSFDFGPVISIKDRATTGPATVVIQGMGVGMISCVPPTIVLVVCIISCNALAKDYGVAISAVGMLATLGITLATDAYGPVADNAGGLAELAGLGPEVRAKTDSLDALGNTTAATGKGFAIGSAVLTALSLLNAYKIQVGVASFDLGDPLVLSGLLAGACMPFLFAALTMISVGKAAAEIIQEVRRQFDEITNEKGCTLRSAIEKASAGETILPEDDVKPDSDKCVMISTRSSVKEMIAPGVYSILVPIFVGFCAGPKCLMGVLAGALVTGCMLAIMMSNAGGAWDNSKKLCEKLKIKKTEQGKACVVGDTVGDPFKDTSGPALNILIKLMSMVSLTIAPLIKGKEDWEEWYLGMVPLGIFMLVTVALVHQKVLTWKDPLEKLAQAPQSEAPKEEAPKEESREPAQQPAVTL